MRILAVGLGGAGGRIVDLLYRTDRRSSKVACVEALAVDVDSDDLSKLTALPGKSKILFPPLDLAHPDDEAESVPTATIDIPEIMGRLQTIPTGETDAIFICAGLGGSLADAAPSLVTALRVSFTEPIFALVTLPCRSEGERCSARSADEIQILAPLLDGMIVFDNDTWYKKIRAQQKSLAPEKAGIASLLEFTKKKERALSPAQKIYSRLNEAIVRRVSLILRAGEFKADGGIELAEVVLDSGEVLNTMRGMGFITIGYAVEQLTASPLGFFARWRPTGYFADEHQKKASRIVELAKQAIYHEISAPCDMTSAHKALVLIAGPSHELSMKGYMTVRKWIDRSIAGLETRSGDYPVTSTRFVAIIVMLSGLGNIPRIEELKDIRAQYKARLADEQSGSEAAAEPVFAQKKPESSLIYGPILQRPALKDEMISVPAETRTGLPGPAGTGTDEVTGPQRDTRISRLHISVPDWTKYNEGLPVKRTGPVRKGHHPAADQQDVTPPGEVLPSREKESSFSIKKILAPRPSAPVQQGSAVSQKGRENVMDTERQRIERELQKQRLMAISGRKSMVNRHPGIPPETDLPRHPGHPGTESTDHPGGEREIPGTARVIVKKQDTKKIVLYKKRDRGHDNDTPPAPQTGESLSGQKGADSKGQADEAASQTRTDDTIDTWIRQVSSLPKAGSAESEEVIIRNMQKTPSDEALLHTDLRRERISEKKEAIEGTGATELLKEPGSVQKKQDIKRSDNDIMWVD